MNTKKHGPSWWMLYLLLPIMIGLFLIEIRLSLPDTGHRLAEVLIFLVFLGSISLWLRANAGALIQENVERWRADLEMDTSPVPPQSVKIVQTNGGSNRQPRRVHGSIYRRLTGWASTISGFFH